jgi:type I restriction enzyme, S subunit
MASKKIPAGWTEKRVGDALEIDNAKRKPMSADERSTMRGPYPYYGPTQIQDWIDEYAYEGRYALIGEDGDHFLKYSSLSMTQIADGKFNVNNHAHAIVGTKYCTTDWFYFYFQNRSLDFYITRQGAKRYKLSKGSLEIIPILLPPMKEQEQIAEILWTWDHAIGKVEALIANARTQKRALMQALLTGGKRLPAFSGDWRWVKFSDVFERVREKNESGNTNVLTISAQDGLISQTEYFNKSVASEDVHGYTLLRRGDFAYNKSYSDGYPFGAFKALYRYDYGIVSSLYICFRLKTDHHDHSFFRHYLEAGLFNREVASIAQEGARNHGLLNVSVVDFFDTSLHAPTHEEQLAIAQVINDAEKEERALASQLAALRQEKSALMQQLLTGKRRVGIAAEAA